MLGINKENVVFYASFTFIVAISAFVFWGPSTLNRKKKKGQPVGLVNLGYTCFLNTLLQAFGGCQSFIDWLARLQEGRANTLTSSLHTVLKVVNGDSNEITDDPYTPSDVIRALMAQGWAISPGEQDAHELFHIIMATLEEETQRSLKRVCSLSDALDVQSSGDFIVKEVHSDQTGIKCSPLHQLRVCTSTCLATCRSAQSFPPFEGLLTNQIQCTVCGHKSSVRYDKFDSLSLPLPATDLTWRKLTLLNLLDNFVSTEVVKDVACEGCTSNGLSPKPTALKTLNFGKLPACLCFHIQRTTWLQNGQAYKRHDYVEFPEFLCMKKYTYTSVQNKQAILQQLYSGQKPEEHLVCSQSNSPFKVRNLYQLMAVVVHTGDLQCGHFVTFRRGGPEGKSWYFTSDAEVRRCMLEEVMGCCAYMLFYNKCPTTE